MRMCKLSLHTWHGKITDIPGLMHRFGLWVKHAVSTKNVKNDMLTLFFALTYS